MTVCGANKMYVGHPRGFGSCLEMPESRSANAEDPAAGLCADPARPFAKSAVALWVHNSRGLCRGLSFLRAMVDVLFLHDVHIAIAAEICCSSAVSIESSKKDSKGKLRWQRKSCNPSERAAGGGPSTPARFRAPWCHEVHAKRKHCVGTSLCGDILCGSLIKLCPSKPCYIMDLPCPSPFCAASQSAERVVVSSWQGNWRHIGADIRRKANLP